MYGRKTSCLSEPGPLGSVEPTTNSARRSLTVAALTGLGLRKTFAGGTPINNRPGGLSYFPMQNVEKMRFRMSSAVVAPVIASIGRSAA